MKITKYDRKRRLDSKSLYSDFETWDAGRIRSKKFFLDFGCPDFNKFDLISDLMKPYQSDEKDAGAHQIQLIDPRKVLTPGEDREISWFSFYAISRILGT